MKYKYDGRGERLVRSEDFEKLGVEHSDVYFTEDNGYTQELSDEAAEALIGHGEPLIAEVEPEQEDPTAEEPAEEDSGEPETKTTRSRKKT